MKKTKKSLVIIAMLMAIVCLMSAFAFSASAADVQKVEVESWSQFREALMAVNNYKPVEIKLTKNIARDFDDYEDFETGLFAVSGKKTVDLNGHIITAEVTIGEENAQYLGGNHFPYLFSFYASNSSLTIKDTSATQTGKVHYDASLVSAKKYITSPICDIFNVTNGDITIEGGTYEVGHERSDWITAYYINGKLFTGTLRTQVYGTVFSVGKDAALTVNGGTFIARGGHFINDFTNKSAYTSYVFDKKSSTNSSIEINGGEFIGKGGAAIFSNSTHRFDINIRNGVFRTSGIDNVLFRYDGLDGGNLKKGDMQITSSMIADGIENKIIVNDNKNYAYAPGSSPQTFFRNNYDTLICTVYDFVRQTPEIPDDRVTSVLEDYRIGTNKVIAYQEKALPKYMTDAGFSTMFSFLVRDSSNTIIATKGGVGLKEYNLTNIKNPGQYTITTSFDLLYNNAVIDKTEHTFIFNAYKSCSHTYTTISNTATCTEAGVLTEVCSQCGDTKTSTAASLGHTYGTYDWSYDGSSHWRYCYRCNQTVNEGIHGYRAGESVCITCGYDDSCTWGNAMDTEYDANYHWWPCDTHSLDERCPNNHQLEKELHTILTIENAGSLEHTPEIEYSCVNGYVCEGCGEYFGETGEHKWVFKNKRGDISSPSCTAQGYIIYRCEYDGKYDCKGNLITCTATKKIYSPEKGHSYDFDNPVSDTATCTQEGICTYKCTRCVVTTTVISPAKGHSYSDWTVLTAPTCTATGKSTATCVNCGYTETMILDTLEHTYGIQETVVAPGCTASGKNVAKCTADGCNAAKEETIDPLGHDMVKVPAKAPTATEDGNIEYYDCSRCDLITSDAEGKKPISSVVVKPNTTTKPETVTAVQNTSAIKLTWSTVPGAAGYRVFVKATNGWNVLGNTTNTTATLTNLTAGTKYTYAIRAIFHNGTAYEFAPDFAIINTATQAVKPAKVAAAQNESAIKLAWSACPGATGYRIFYKAGNTWKVSVSTTTATSHTYTNLKAGAKFTFAIRPYILVDGIVIWSDFVEFTTATKPAAPVAKATSPSAGKITLAYGAVNGADGYQVYYSVNGGAYKLYKVYGSAGTLNFANLKSGTKYTFAVRAGIKTSGGNIYGAYNPVTVTVK